MTAAEVIVAIGAATSIVLAVPAAGGAQTAAAEPVQAPLSLEQLEQMALANNPTVRQADAGIEVARGRAKQAGLLPNPTIGYTGDEIAPGAVIRGGEHGAFIEQTIPLGGKLRLSRDIFEREVRQAQAVRNTQRQRIASLVRVLFHQALTLERRVEVGERLATLAFEAVGVSRQLYNVGAADKPDVLESEIEARRTQLDLTAARNERFAVWRQIAVVAGDPQLTPRPLVGTIDSSIPELERGAALERLLNQSPEVETARASVERAKSVVARARREPFPDLFVRGGALYNRELLETGGGGGDRRPVGWEAQLEAGFSIPLFNRNSGGVAAARAEVVRAEAEMHRVELSIESRLAGVFDAYLTALRSAEEYRTEILPRAEEAYTLYLARYREMAAAYPQVLIAQRTLFQMSDAYLNNVEEAWRTALQIQGFLITDGLAAPIGPGEPEMGANTTGADMPTAGAMRMPAIRRR